MNRLFILLSFLILPVSYANAGVDETVNNLTAPIAKFISDIVFFSIPFFGVDFPLVVLWLVVGAAFFTVYRSEERRVGKECS